MPLYGRKNDGKQKLLQEENDFVLIHYHHGLWANQPVSLLQSKNRKSVSTIICGSVRDNKALSFCRTSFCGGRWRLYVRVFQVDGSHFDIRFYFYANLEYPTAF